MTKLEQMKAALINRPDPIHRTKRRRKDFPDGTKVQAEYVGQLWIVTVALPNGVVYNETGSVLSDIISKVLQCQPS